MSMAALAILAGAAIKGTAVFAVAWLAALALRRRSAAARHLVWTAAAAALIALPLLTLILPALRLPVQATGPMAIFRVESYGHAGSGNVPARAVRAAAPAGSASPAAASDWQRWIPVVWAAGAAIGILQMFWAGAVLWRLRRSARPMDSAGLALGLCDALGIAHPVEFLETERGTMPMTCGVFRPTVLLPAGAEDWSPERLRVVLLHELAHVRRGDVATHLLARTALSLYWWNPLAWMAWRRFVQEREHATDDLVLAAGERASEYAGHLLDVARSLQAESVTAWAALAMARRSQLEGRLVAILDSRVNRKPAGRMAAAAAVIVALAAVAPFAALEAQDPALPPDVDATMRAAMSQRNHELLDTAASAYASLARYDVAQKLLESSLAIRQQVGGTGSPAYAAGLVKLGSLAAERRRGDEAEAFFTQAATVSSGPEVSPALLYLGMKAYTTDNYDAADEYFQRILRNDPHGKAAGPAMTWLAGVRRHRTGREAEVESLYQRALAVENPPSLDTLNTLTNYAGFLRTQKRFDEANDLDTRADRLRQSGVTTAGMMPTLSTGLRVGNGVTAPSLIAKIEPEYSESARKAKISGTVLLYIVVDPDGRASNMRVLRGLEPSLDQKALDAVARWKFRPGTKDGMPVPVQATIEVNFRLM
jgi:TonB family protein